MHFVVFSCQAALSTSLGIDDEECELLLKQYKEKEGSTFPCQIGKGENLITIIISNITDSIFK